MPCGGLQGGVVSRMERVASVGPDGSAWEVRSELTGMHEVDEKPLSQRTLQLPSSVCWRGNASVLDHRCLYSVLSHRYALWLICEIFISSHYMNI